MPKQPKYSIHVAVPTYGNSPAICQLSFGSFIGNGVAMGLVQNIGEVDGAYIDRSRNDLVRQALTNGSTHVMFVDQDMIIPEGALQRLVDQRAPYVAGIYFGKDDFFTPVAFHLDPFRRIYELEDCPSTKSKAKLPKGVLDCVCGVKKNHVHSVGGAGMGCTLISTKLFKQVDAHFKDERWFSSKDTGEDIHFALRCKEIGVDRLLDGFVQCGHVRNQIVTRQHYDWARQSAPVCMVEDCTRTAFWDVSDADTAEKAERCWLHKEDNNG